MGDSGNERAAQPRGGREAGRAGRARGARGARGSSRASAPPGRQAARQSLCYLIQVLSNTGSSKHRSLRRSYDLFICSYVHGQPASQQQQLEIAVLTTTLLLVQLCNRHPLIEGPTSAHNTHATSMHHTHRSLLLGGVLALAEDGGAHAHVGAAPGDGLLEVPRHAHAQLQAARLHPEDPARPEHNRTQLVNIVSQAPQTVLVRPDKLT
jgi:hypothetical protein